MISLINILNFCIVMAYRYSAGRALQKIYPAAVYICSAVMIHVTNYRYNNEYTVIINLIKNAIS